MEDSQYLLPYGVSTQWCNTYLEHGLLILGERILTDKLHDFGELILSLEDLSHLLTEVHEIWLVLVVILVKSIIVVREGDVPVDGGEMLTLGQLLIQTPENTDDGEGGGGDGIGKITTWWGDGTNDRDGTGTVGATEASDVTGTLVELGEGGAQVSGETGIGGHLSETTGDFSEGLGPTRGGVSHHSDVLTLITEVLSQGDTSVDGGLSGGDGHVGGVCDEASTLHDIVHLAVDLSLELREVIEHFSHLVTALTASDVDDTVGVGVLGESLRDTGLSAAEGAWDSASTTLHGGEEGVQHTLTGGQRVDWSELLSARSGSTHGPEMRHTDVLALAVGGLDDGDALRNVVLTLRHDFNDSTVALGRSHDDMLTEEIILENVSELVSAGDEGTWALLEVGNERVEFVLVEGGQIDATGHENGIRDLGDGLERSLDSIEDSLENTYSQEL